MFGIKVEKKSAVLTAGSTNLAAIREVQCIAIVQALRKLASFEPAMDKLKEFLGKVRGRGVRVFEGCEGVEGLRQRGRTPKELSQACLVLVPNVWFLFRLLRKVREGQELRILGGCRQRSTGLGSLTACASVRT